jgi:hypothetical protein
MTGVGQYGGGKGYPAPGLRGGPPRLSDAEWAQPKGGPVPPVDSFLIFLGLKIALPPRAAVKVDHRARLAWVRAGGVVRQYAPEGEQHVTPAGQRALLEGWSSL